MVKDAEKYASEDQVRKNCIAKHRVWYKILRTSIFIFQAEAAEVLLSGSLLQGDSPKLKSPLRLMPTV